MPRWVFGAAALALVTLVVVAVVWWVESQPPVVQCFGCFPSPFELQH
jgi:hypothetical protein